MRDTREAADAWVCCGTPAYDTGRSALHGKLSFWLTGLLDTIQSEGRCFFCRIYRSVPTSVGHGVVRQVRQSFLPTFRVWARGVTLSSSEDLQRMKAPFCRSMRDKRR